MKIIIYKIMALLAFASALALGIVTLHFSLTRAEIAITTRETGQTLNFDITLPIVFGSEISAVKKDDSATDASEEEKSSDEIKALRQKVLGEEEKERQGELNGVSYTLPVTIYYTALPEGAGTEVQDYATGVVTIISELPFSQALVARTRLLSPDGILFRTTERVTVPARGASDVTVKADQTGKSGDILPTSFTIPGLSAERQKQVYGKSSEPFTGGVRVIKTITENDLTLAKNEALKNLKIKAIEAFNASGILMTSGRVVLNETVFESEDQAGEEKEELSITASGQAHGIEFDEELLIKTVKESFAGELPKGQEVLGYNEESFTYALEEINIDDEKAIIAATIEGFITLGEKETIVSPDALSGLSAKEIQAKILKNDAVNSVEVRFSPFWVTRAPRIPEKITITIRNADGKF
ncbi:MAG: hypothetical protein HY564_01960 [Candidatus Jacksonbacteria bacterium]|nr:hypothetical protein [Candidatus Jacksonbacteria bacterium]